MSFRVLAACLAVLIAAPSLAESQQPPADSPAKSTPQSPTDAAANQPQPGAPATPGSREAGAPTAGQLPVVVPLPREEHVIYVPFRNLREIFEKSDMSVMLPYAQFLEMWNRLQNPPPNPPLKPPIAGVISRADYVGTIEGELARLTATLTVDVLGDEWARLPIVFGDAAVGEVRSADAAVLVRGAGDGNYELLARGKGTHQVTFQLASRVTSSPDGKRFAISCPPVGVSNLDLTLPEAGITVEVTPRQTAQTTPGEANQTRVRAVLGSTDRLAVAWRPKSGQIAEVAGLASVSDLMIVDVGDGVVHTHATFDYQILRGSLDALVLSIPAEQRLLDVQVPGLRDWQTEVADGRQRLTVRLHAAAREKIRLELHTESAIPDAAFGVAQLQAVGAARESGLIAVRSAEDIGLEFVTHEAVTRIDATEAPEALRKPRSSFYKFFSPAFRLAVQASALQPRVTAESFLTVAIDKSRLGLRGDFKFDVTRAGIFTVRFRMPAAFNLDDVQCAEMDRHELATQDGVTTVTVHLTKKVQGELKLTLTASQPRTVAGGDLDLPLIEPRDLSLERGLIAVFAPQSFEVNSDPTKLESARAATPEELAGRGFNPAAPPNSSLSAAFAFSRRPVRVGLALRERPRRVLASVATIAAVKEDVVNVTTRIRYDVQFAGANTFRIAVPGPVADRVQIQGPGIREQRKADKPEADGFVVWTVVLHTDVLGSHELTATYDEKLVLPGQGAVDARVQPVRVLDVDREVGEIAVQKDRSLALTAGNEGLEEIDARELTLAASGDQPYLSFRYFRHPARLTLSVAKHEIEGVVRTVIPRAYIEAVVNRDGPVTVRARYWVKSSEKQRLRVDLPAERVLGVRVAGRDEQPEKAPAGPNAAADVKPYYINIARSTDVDAEFPLAIVFETAAPPGGELGWTDALKLRLPQFDAGVKFQQLYVRLWVPERYRAVGEPTGFVSETRHMLSLWGLRPQTRYGEEPAQWFTDEAGTFDFRTAGHDYVYSSLTGPAELAVRYWHLPAMTVAASVVALAIGGLLLVFRVETRVFCVFVAVLGVLFASLFWPESVTSWLDAARLGITAAMALWLVRLGLRVGRAIPLRLAAAGAGSVLLGAAQSSAPATPPSDVPPPPRSPAAEAPAAPAADALSPPATDSSATDAAPLATDSPIAQPHAENGGRHESQ